ncbi:MULTISPECIES: HrpE/YscL family type III secretion apparatus protein [unclassified Symbiopectobacterium]|uniref:HrpE/YscL family type III secretion apparatus protein n=2 Tax=Symbiopectobacterium TaxID=801 RepID=UPI002226AFE8|nr:MULTISPECIES: HrpE/YscL family type III secretion apparatus protein [unclassified Symbiopectobacterium]MCW2474988.1 HrpE/YscL family type III secretion apparatus protein [Candidatus Symbiopectobacterium sp. NZEC151]MCW2486832.1 HrpE/YscL family type III secretion apparatus protein [Candidatus Symbiopectobacterium sp. NZEC127]
MPLCRLPLIELDGQLPDFPVIPAERLNTQLAYAHTLRDAHQEAATIVKAASRKAEHMIRQARKAQRQIQNEAYAEFSRRQQEILTRCENQWLARHVVALCEAASVEQCVVQAVTSRIRLAMRNVLSAWFSQQPVDDLLCDRLSQQVAQLAAAGCTTLQIHPEREARMREAFGERLAIACNPQLAVDEAVLTSSQLSVSFSLSRHFQQVLAWIDTENELGIHQREVRRDDENA